MSATVHGSVHALVIGPADGAHLNVMNTDTHVKLTGADTGGLLSMFVITANPGDGVPMHTHTREDEIFYVLEGRIRFETPDGTQVGGVGTTVYLPRGGCHAWFAEGEVPAKALILTLPGTFDAFFAEIASPAGTHPDMGGVIATCLRYGITFSPPKTA